MENLSWIREELTGPGASLTDCGDGCHDFTEFQLVQDRSLSGSIEADHQDSHLLLTPKLIEELRKCETHVGGCT